MKIHPVSDVHLGGAGAPPLPKYRRDVCILVGDIGEIDSRLYRWYLTEIRKRFKHVIMVMGNHEYYGVTFAEGLERAQEITKEFDIHLLDVNLGTENLVIDGVTFWGSTLWTDFNKNDFFARNAFVNNLNDSKIIKGFTADESLRQHQISVEKINWNADVVISHHRPIFRKHIDLEISDNTYSFCCTTLEDRIYDSKIKYWFFGHTHDNSCIDVGGTKVVSNQVNCSRNGPQYDPKFFVEI